MYEVDTKELRKRMIDAGCDTIDSLSDRSGVNRNTLSDVINGKAYPSSMVMTKIGAALGIPGEDMGRIFFAPKLA